MWSYPFNAIGRKIRQIHFFAAAAILTDLSVMDTLFLFPNWERQKWFWNAQPVILQRYVFITVSLKIWDYLTEILSAIVQSCSQASHLLISYLRLLLHAARMRVWGQIICVVPSLGRSHQGRIDGTRAVRLCVPWRMSQKAGQTEAGFCLFFFFLLLLAI